jgi:hypothetical protein
MTADGPGEAGQAARFNMIAGAKCKLSRIMALADHLNG